MLNYHHCCPSQNSA